MIETFACGQCLEKMDVIKNDDGTIRLERKNCLNCPYQGAESCGGVALLIQEIEELKNDVERQMKIANEHVNENNTLKDQLASLTNHLNINSISNLKSQLSNRDKEIKELKEAICVPDTDSVAWIKGIEKLRFDIEASLQSKEGEEE